MSERGLAAFGRYQLLRRIGAGGMAELFEALAPDGTVVALKRILPHLDGDAEAAKLFLDEARWVERLRHPNVVAVHHSGELEGVAYLVMELVRGCDLARLLARADEGRLAPGLAAFVAGEVCRALSYVHELRGDDGAPLGLIHRDVKPANVLLGFNGTVKLADFGIAKASAAVGVKTRTGVCKGTVGYLSPEQRDGAPLDARVDLFQAGVLLEEMLTGTRSGGPGPLIAPDLAAICRRASAEAPSERYARAAEMAVALSPLVDPHGSETLSALVHRWFPEKQLGGRWREETKTAPQDNPSRKLRPALALLLLAALALAALWIGRPKVLPAVARAPSRVPAVATSTPAPTTDRACPPTPSVVAAPPPTPSVVADPPASSSSGAKHRRRVAPVPSLPSPVPRERDFLPDPFHR